MAETLPGGWRENKNNAGSSNTNNAGYAHTNRKLRAASASASKRPSPQDAGLDSNSSSYETMSRDEQFQ